MTLQTILNPENASIEEASSWPVRYTARAVVFDDAGKIALLSVQKQKYYKLPGGGIEAGEAVKQALERECLEETGCQVATGEELGIVYEYRKMFCLQQVSTCFLARVVGPKGSPEFTDSEKADDFSVLWCELNEAQKLLDTCRPVSQEGRDYIVPRDKLILAEALKMIGSIS